MPRAPLAVALLCPLPVGVVAWRAPEPTRTVIVKATFSIAGDGPARLAPEQEPLSRGEPGLEGELGAPSDFVPLKARVDVLVAGAAHADAPTYVLSAGFAVDGLRKRFYAVRDEPCERVPLSPRYLRAAPSIDAAPVRVGPVRARPSIDDALPVGFDYAAFNVAPDDQQLDVLSAAARIVLEGLVPGGDRRTVKLTGARPRVFILPDRGTDAGRPAREVALRADTLFIDGDRELCTLTWRGVIAVPPDDAVSLVVALAAGGERLTWSAVQRRLPEASWTEAATLDDRELDDDLGFDAEVTVDREPATLTVPLRAAATSAPRLGLGGLTLGGMTLHRLDDDETASPVSARAPPPPAPPPPSPPPSHPAASVLAGAESLSFARPQAAVPGLPFRRGGLVLGQSAALASFAGADPSADAATPFRAVGSPPPTGSTMIQPETDTDDFETAELDLLADVDATGPGATLPFHFTAPRADLAAAPPGGAPAPPTALPFRFTPPPVEHAIRMEAPIALTIGQRTSVEPQAAASEPVAPPAPKAALSIERYAGIKVAVWNGDDLASVLARHAVSDASWCESERRLSDAIAKEASCGQSTLAAAVAEALRVAQGDLPSGDDRPLRALQADYAALLAAIEGARDPAAVLAMSGVHAGAFQRMQRRFRERALVDASLRESLPALVSAARRAASEPPPAPTSLRPRRRAKAPAGATRVPARKP